MPTAPLEVHEQPLGLAHLIEAEGEIDHLTAPRVADALRRATVTGDGHVVLDLTSTSFIDSAGISTLLNGLRRLTRQRRRMVIVCPPGPPLRVFELLGLVGTFDIVATREDAAAGG